MQVPRRTPLSLSLGSLGDFRMRILIAIAFIGLVAASGQANPIFSRAYGPAGCRLVLELPAEVSTSQLTFDLVEQSLPITAGEAGKLAVKRRDKQEFPPVYRTDVRSVELVNYAVLGSHDRGKFFYLVELASFSSHKDLAGSSFRTHWAVLPDGSVHWVQFEKHSP